MAKKTITKEHPITAFRKANEARDVVVKSSMKKMQVGGTPFQGYMKTPGAVASDTTIYNDTRSLKPKAKNPKNQKALEGAFDKTYGYDRSYTGSESEGETYDQYRRRMGPSKKTGGDVKTSIKKMQTGGVKIKESSKDAYYKNNTQNFKEYKATIDGTVKSTRKSFPDKPSKPAIETTQSMDTTGYAKGKKSFKLTNSSVDLIDKKVYGAKPKVTVKNISRNDVKKVIGGMKSNIGKASKKK